MTGPSWPFWSSLAERTVRAIVAYDGTDFLGFQRQASGRTVQGALETAFERLYGRPVNVRGAGRTDAGVHATGQVIAARVPDIVPAERLGLALRAYLPGDLAVRQSGPAPEGFDPRRSAISRRYRYVVVQDRFADPLRDRFATRVEPGLAVAAMRTATAALIGEHDFGSLCCDGGQRGSTVRRMLCAELLGDERLELVLEADSFLYRQVRCIVGVLLAIGRGRLEPEWTERLLTGEPWPAGVSVAPPTGLVLERVRYGESDEAL